MSKIKIHLSAFGVHVGGGLILLQSLLPYICDRLEGIAFDARLSRENFGKFGKNIIWIPKNILYRLLSVNELARNCKQEEVLFCFNSLPPIVKCLGRVIVYVHAPHFVGLHVGIKYDLISRIRFLVERLWFRIGAKHVNEFWVQTESMQRALLESFPYANIRLMPFVDEDLAKSLRSLESDEKPLHRQPSVYFYPADGVGHKNHVVLLQAWEYLASKHCNDCPKLLLTLNPQIFSQTCKIASISDALPHIINLGPLKREEVLKILKNSNGLIFPSRAETFGLPLLEAMATRTSILASERDFSRDVCTPDQTFDPCSRLSIARAVERHIGLIQSFPKYLSAAEISDEIK